MGSLNIFVEIVFVGITQIVFGITQNVVEITQIVVRITEIVFVGITVIVVGLPHTIRNKKRGEWVGSLGFT